MSKHSDIEFVPPSFLEQQLAQEEHLAQDVKPWLLSFGNIKPGTSVSIRFKIEPPNLPKAKPFSMLPLLTVWVKSWFDKSLYRATSDPQDRNNLTWLFQYIADYVDLGHCQLNHEEVHELCLALLDVCLNARHQAHLEGCLSGLLAVARTGEFPRDCVKDVLLTLSSANVILDKPLSRAGDVVKLLATGSLQKEAVTDLFSALSVVAETQKSEQSQPDLDLSKLLNPARGAIRYLSTLLEVCGLDEKFVIDIRELLGILKDSAETRLLRIATEILDLLSSLLASSRVDELLSDEGLVTTLLDIYDRCKEASIVPDSSDHSLTKTKSPKEDQIKRERRYKRDHEQSLTRFQEKLLSILPIMDLENAARAWKDNRDILPFQPAHKRTNTIEYLKNTELCVPGKNPGWREELDFLLDKIVTSDTTEADAFTEQQEWGWKQPPASSLNSEIDRRIQQRIEVLQLCARAIDQAATLHPEACDNSSTLETPVDIGNSALKKLLKVFLMETNGKVIQALLDESIKLCEISSAADSQQYASTIITSLEEGILKHAQSGHEAEAIFFAATEALRSIFLQGLGHKTGVACRAYIALVKIADCKACMSLRCRLTAMSVLVRVRCDTLGLVYIENASESVQIAGTICKTSESLGAMFTQLIERAADEDKDALSSKRREIFQRQLWMYPDEETSFKQWHIPESYQIHVKGSGESESSDLDIDVSKWVFVVASNLQQDREWETYSYILVHVRSQLTNTKLFEPSQELLHQLRGFLCGRVRESEKMFVPPQDIGLDKADVALCFYHILARMIPFYKIISPASKYEGFDVGRRGVDLVRAFKEGISRSYEGTARSCIHALSICCFEIPEAIASEYPGIVEAMAQNIFRPHLLVHILEFLAQVARLPHLHSIFRESEIRQILYICIRALQAIRQKDEVKTTSVHDLKRGSLHTRRGAMQTPYRAAMMKEKGLPQYSCALAYHTMIFWFLSIPLGRRHKYVKDVTEQLTWKDSSGQDNIDEQTIVMIDMMQRSAFSDLPETSRDESFGGDEVETAMYLVGNSVVMIETNKMNGLSQITKRQASGTTHAIYRPNVPPLPVHHDTSFFEQLEERGFRDNVAPSHTLLNMIASAVPVELQEQPLRLNMQEEYVARGIRMIDLKPTVDSHKIGIVLLKDGQTQEVQYLANSSGTLVFDQFLDSIGTRVSLKPPTPFIPWGLVYGEDGTETIAWRDRINEIVFQVSTLMPSTEDEIQARTKSNIGNCHVLVVFNQSNEPWKWTQFASQVITVQIIITPANRVSSQGASDDYDHEYYQVEVLTQEEYQNISAAAEAKVVSKATLAPFVRMLALNANIFSECARNTRTGDAEFPSSWRYRLQEILMLKERTQQRVLEREDSTARRYDFSQYT